MQAHDGDLDGRAVRERPRLGHADASRGALADECCEVVLLEAGSEDLSRRGRLPVDQDDDRRSTSQAERSLLRDDASALVVAVDAQANGFTRHEVSRCFARRPRIAAQIPTQVHDPTLGTRLTLLEQQTFAVVANTRAFDWLRERAAAFDIDAKIIPVDSYEAGVQSLIDGTTDVLFGDRAILLEAAKRNAAAHDLTLLDRRFTNEPVALVLARGDEDFRLVVDQKLSQTIRSDAFRSLYARWFGEFDQASARFFRDTVLPD